MNGKFVGAFGVGGGSWGQDEKIGRTVLKAFEAETKVKRLLEFRKYLCRG